MYQSVNFSMFCDAFNSVRRDNFSYEGLRVLFDYLEQIESDTGEEMELDVIALCCDYTESSIADALKQYDIDDIEALEAQTTVLHVDDETIIYQQF